MDAASKKASIIAIAVQLILTGMSVVSKAAFNEGMSTFVFVFYRQAAGSVLLLPLAMHLHRKNAPSVPFLWMLKLFFCALVGNTLSLTMYNLSLKFTSATVASATNNSMPVLTFCLALLLRMEVVKLRSGARIAKVAGAGLCLAGALTIAFYTGPWLSLVSHHRHRAFAAHTGSDSVGHANHSSKVIWIEGTFLMILANMAWAISIVWQAALLKECPNKILVATGLCVFSTVQSFVVAAAVERDFSRWRLRPDVGLFAVGYSGFLVTGVSYYLQAWCVEMKGPVFFAFWTPLCFVLTIFCSSFFLGEMVHLGSIVGGILMVGGLYSVLWGKSKESESVPCNEVNMIGCEQDDEQGNSKSGNYELEELATSASALGRTIV